MPSQSIWEDLDEDSMQINFPKEAYAPSLLDNKRQQYQIWCIKRNEQMLQKNNKMKP